MSKRLALIGRRLAWDAVERSPRRVVVRLVSERGPGDYNVVLTQKQAVALAEAIRAAAFRPRRESDHGTT